MRNENINRILLTCIVERKSIDPLIKLGYSYNDILEVYRVLFDEKYIMIDNDQCSLTEKGTAYLKTLNKKLPANKRIYELKDIRTIKMDIFDIYLP